MDTKKDSSTSDVPTFKVARVGQERKRKGAGLSFLRGGGTRGVWSGAAGGTGGSGAAGLFGLGVHATKMAILLLVSVAGLGAVSLGRMMGEAQDQVKKPKAFSMSRDAVKLEGDTSNLPSTSNTIPNSLGYLTGSRDGLTPEERAKKEAEAAAAAEAQRKADEEAAKKAEQENAAKPVDPKDLLASAKADGGNAPAKGGAGFGKKFGSLTSSFGGGSALSGGAGLSGGVNRQFGSAGSITKGTSGQLAAMKGTARPTYSKAGNSKLAASNAKGFARKQLANANAYSRRGMAASKGETAAQDASSAFDNNQGAGNVISGPGIGKGKTSTSGADSTPNPGNGSPTGGDGTASGDCGANRYQDANGACQNIQDAGAKDANPMLTILAGVVMAALVVIGVLAGIALAMEGSVFGYAWAKVVETAIFALGLVVGLAGLAMMAMGDYVTGGIATLLGGTIAGFAYWAPASLTPGWGLAAGIGGAAMTMAGKMLGGGGKKAPAAAQQ